VKPFLTAVIVLLCGATAQAAEGPNPPCGRSSAYPGLRCPRRAPQGRGLEQPRSGRPLDTTRLHWLGSCKRGSRGAHQRISVWRKCRGSAYAVGAPYRDGELAEQTLPPRRDRHGILQRIDEHAHPRELSRPKPTVLIGESRFQQRATATRWSGSRKSSGAKLTASSDATAPEGRTLARRKG